MNLKKLDILLLICFVGLMTMLTSKSYAISYDTTITKGCKIYYYDSNNRLLRKVRKEYLLRKGYSWQFDTLGNITAKGPIKLRQRHGRWKLLDSDAKYVVKKYKYGLDKSVIDSTYGHKMDIIITAGRAARRGQDEKHRVIYKPVAGCVVSRKLLFIRSFNNTFIRVKKRIRYGKNWETEATYDW